MKQKLLIIAALFVAFVLPTSVVSAQSTTSSIVGHVSDANGNLQDAIVTAVYMPTKVVYRAITNKDGSYRINGAVAGGPYTIKVEMMGHKTVTFTDVQAPLGEAVIVDFVLENTSTVLDAVVISAEGNNSSMGIQNSGANTRISSRTIERMPTSSRSMNDIMKLTPQSSNVGGGFAVGGGSYRGSMVTVDGASFNNSFGIGSNLPGGGSPISLDAIKQLSVNITPFDVRQSGFQGGAINVVTKSGSNEWHSSVYDYYTANTLRGLVVEDELLAYSAALNNTAGFTLSGPIVKDKLFFFVNAEYTVDKIPGSNAVAQENYDAGWAPGSAVHRPTVGKMDSIRNFLIDNYGYDPGRYQGYSLNTPDYKILARLDWNINDNNQFNIRFSHTHNYNSNSPSSSMSPLGGTNTTFNIGGVNYTVNRYTYGRSSDYSLYFESSRYYQEENFTSLAAELVSHLFEGKGSNTLRATWSLQNEPRSFEGDLFPTVDILEPYTDANNATQYAFYTTFGIDPFTYSNLRKVNILNLTDELTYAVGKHNLIGGLQIESNSAVNGFMQGGAGWYIFDSWQSFANGGTPLSMMITHANLDDPTETVYPTFNSLQFSLYAQDEIEFSRYFKLTAGVRLELPVVSFPNDNLNKEFATIAENNPNSSFAGLSTDNLPGLKVNVSPRLGFNWDVLKDRSLVVRGGTGIFTGRIPNVWLVSAAGNANVLQYQYIANLTTGNPVVPFAANRDDIINSIYAGTPFKQQDLPAPTGATILDKNLSMPSSWKSSLAVDAKLPFGFKGTLEGIYSYNYNEVVATTLGYKLGDSIQLPGEPEKRPTYTSENISNGNGARINGYLLHNAKEQHGRYYSITAQLQKEFDFGLELMAAYTHSFSLSVTDGTGDQVYSMASVNNVGDVNSHELGHSSYVIPNRLIASIGYTISQSDKQSTRFSLFYEGYNSGIVGGYVSAAHSYLMNNVSGLGGSQLVYIPTADELASMPFSSNENRDAYEAFISGDAYLSAHRGEYSQRNAVACPWVNRISFKVDQMFYFDIKGQRHTLEIGLDINNVANMFNSEWGLLKQLSSETVLSYSGGQYTFTQPVWNSYKNFASTWQALLHLRYSF